MSTASATAAQPSAATLEDAVLARHGRRTNAEIIFQCPCPENHKHGDANPSARYNATKAVWVCDVCKVGGGARDLAERLGVEVADDAKGNGHHKRPLGVRAEWNGKPFTASWYYRDSTGHELGLVCRFDGPDGKDVVPFFSRDGNRWRAGGVPKPSPLFGLDVLAAQPLAPVYVPEGERCAEAIHRLVGVAVTSQGGSGSAAKADWTPLRGRDVIVWPDNDAPGVTYGRDVVDLVLTAGARSVRVVDVAQLGLGPGGDVVDFLAAHPDATLATLEALPMFDQGRRRLIVYELAAFMALQVPPRETYLDPWLHSCELVMVYGWRGCGKSYFVETQALALATGGRVFGWLGPKPRAVLLVDGELPTETLQGRLAMLGMGATPPLVPTAPFRILAADCQDGGIPDLATPLGQQLVEEHLHGVDVLILDNLAALTTTTDENATEAWQPMKGWLLSLRRRGKTVIFVHHAGKNGGQRGASGREDNLDVVLALRRPEDYQPGEGARFEVHFEKARALAGTAVEPFETRLEAGPNGDTVWTMKAVSDRQLEQIVELGRTGLTSRQIAMELGDVSRATVSRRLLDAKKRGLL